MSDTGPDLKWVEVRKEGGCVGCHRHPERSGGMVLKIAPRYSGGLVTRYCADCFAEIAKYTREK